MDKELFDQALQLIQAGIVAVPETLDGFLELVDTLRREVPTTVFAPEPAIKTEPPVPGHLTDGYVTYESTLNGLSFDSDNWEASYDETPGGETFIFTRKRANKIPTADEVFGIFGD